MEEAGAGRAGRPSAERRLQGRAHEGEGARPHPGHRPRLRPTTHPHRSPKAGADLGSHGRGWGEEEQETKRGPRGCGGTSGARERAPCCSTDGLLSDCAPRPGRHVEGSLTAEGDPGALKRVHRNCTTHAWLHHSIRLPVDKATSTRSPPPPQMLCLPRLTILFSNPNFLGDIPTFIPSPCSPRQWMPLFELWGTEVEGGREVRTEVRTAGAEVKEWEGRGAQPGCDCS